MNKGNNSQSKSVVSGVSSVKDHMHIVLCREHYNPLGIIRSLGEAGLRPVAIIIKGKIEFVGSSKYISKTIYVQDIQETVEVLQKEFGKMDLKPFVYITDDYFLEYIDEHYDDFKESYIVSNAGSNGRIAYYMNKDHINQLARDCGINVPMSAVVPKGKIPTNLKYPVITKAISSTSGAWKKDSFICNSESELIDAYSKIKGETILIQEFIDRKGEFNIDGISVNHGKSVFLSMVTDYIYLVPGRYSTYMDVKNTFDKKLSDQIKQIIERIGFEGIFDGEFMVGKDDKVYFLEINFRPNAFNYASTCAGMNDPYLWAKGMLEGKVQDNCYKKIPNGFRAMVENSDFKDRVLSKRVSALKWIIDFIKCDCHFYFNIHDIRPFLKAFVFKTRK